MAFVNEMKDKKDPSTWRTIDYERNLILRHVDRSIKNKVESFALEVDGYSVKFSGILSKEFHDRGEATFNYELEVIEVPGELKSRKSEIKQYIVEALDAYGSLYNRTNIRKVNVALSPVYLKNF